MKAFPPEFSDTSCVLLLQKRTYGINARGMNNYLKRYFRKLYKGKFEMASLDDILKNPKYQDRKIYRFVLTDAVWSNNTTVTTSTSHGTMIEYNNAYRLDYHLYDLLKDKHYPDLGVSSNVPAKAMKRSAVLLNKRYLNKL